MTASLASSRRLSLRARFFNRENSVSRFGQERWKTFFTSIISSMIFAWPTFRGMPSSTRTSMSGLNLCASTAASIASFQSSTVISSGTSCAIEANIPISQRKNGVSAAEANVLARQKFRPALPHDDITSHDQFAAKSFHAQPFADAVAPVLDAALSLFVSHLSGSMFDVRCPMLGVWTLKLLFRLGFLLAFRRADADALDLHPRQLTAMPDRAVITFAPFKLERDPFFIFSLLDHFSRHFCSGNDRVPMRHLIAA